MRFSRRADGADLVLPSPLAALPGRRMRHPLHLLLVLGEFLSPVPHSGERRWVRVRRGERALTHSTVPQFYPAYHAKSDWAGQADILDCASILEATRASERAER